MASSTEKTSALKNSNNTLFFNILYPQLKVYNSLPFIFIKAIGYLKRLTTTGNSFLCAQSKPNTG